MTMFHFFGRPFWAWSYPLAVILWCCAPLAAEEGRHRDLTEITITADPFQHSILEHNSPVSVLQKEQVVVGAEPTLGETIRNEPGVSSSYAGPGSSRPIIRGNAGDRVRVLKNGIGTLDVSNTSEDHAVSSNPLAAESIEILRGPETLLYGSSAIGGIVNVTDGAIAEQPVGNKLSGSAEFRHGTADDELSGAAALSGQLGSFNWYVDYYHQDTNNIEIPGFAESKQLRAQEEAEGEEHEEGLAEGTLPNSDTRSQGFTIGGSRVWNEGFFGISISGLESNYGVPGHAHEEEEEHGEGDGEAPEHSSEDLDEDGVAIDLEQLRFDMRGRLINVSPKIEDLKYKLGVATYEHKELEGDEVGTVFEQDALEGRLEATHSLLMGWQGVVGTQLQLSDFSAVGDESFLPETDTIAPALFAFEELPVNDFWTIQTGGRYEYTHYRADGFASDEFHPLSFSGGLNWDPSGESSYTVGLAAAYTQRAPSVSELYADGPHIARQIFEIGDANLNVEQSYGLDLTLRKNVGLLTGVANLFVQRYRDYINLIPSGAESDGLPVFQYQATRALFWGFELDTTLHLHELLRLWAHSLDLDVQVDFVRARDTTRSEEIPRIPPLRTIVALDYRYQNYAGVRLEGVFVEEQDRVADFELPTDDYQLFNIYFDSKLPLPGATQLTFFMRGSNLTDEEARVHSSFLKDLAPLRGRSFLFGLRTTF